MAFTRSLFASTSSIGAHWRRWQGFIAALLLLLSVALPPVTSSPLAAPRAPLPVPAASGPAAPTGDAERPVYSQSVEGEPPSIASNFPRAAMVDAAWETGKIGAIPPSNAPDVLGAFRFICTPGQLRYDDPVVFAGQPGKSHLHQFFGNTKANAFSTYESLRTTGDSTCMNVLNRSAYWIPAMLDGRGNVIRPDYVSIYYKRVPDGSPACQKTAKRCGPIPRGLRFVFGYDMVTHDPGPTAGGAFNCDGNGARQGHYKTIVEAAPNCPAGSRLGAVMGAPSCWDGKRLDSPNHRDHLAYTSYGSWGYERCPSSHPVLIPSFTIGAWYSVDDTLRRDGQPSWHLSSDEMPGMKMPPGSTFHADWFGAWDDATMDVWTKNCIGKLLNCSGGDLGNGTQLKQVAAFSWNANPRRVPVPPRPAVEGVSAPAAASTHAGH